MPLFTVTATIRDVKAGNKAEAEGHIERLLGHAGYNIQRNGGASAMEQLPVEKVLRQTGQPPITTVPAAAATPAATPAKPTEPKA